MSTGYQELKLAEGQAQRLEQVQASLAQGHPQTTLEVKSTRNDFNLLFINISMHFRKVLTPRATRTEPVLRQSPRQSKLECLSV